MEENQDIRIYCFYYKETAVPIKNELHIPLMAGNALHPNGLGMTGDDTGISISDKNHWYSELTGIYWVWKNTSHDITGSCHYRRYFSRSEAEPADIRIKRILYYLAGLYKKRYGLIYTGNIKRFSKEIINRVEVMEILKSHDAILPVRRKLRYSVEEHYRRYHNPDDLVKIRQILNNNHSAYLPAYDTMLKNNSLYANNMFILPSFHFNRFMQWWFSVLFEFENQIDLKKYKGYQQRVFGFIAERLLTTWFLHENLKIKELPVIYFKKIKYST